MELVQKLNVISFKLQQNKLIYIIKYVNNYVYFILVKLRLSIAKLYISKIILVKVYIVVNMQKSENKLFYRSLKNFIFQSLHFFNIPNSFFYFFMK